MTDSEMGIVQDRAIKEFDCERRGLPRALLRKHHDPWREDAGSSMWIFYFDILGKPKNFKLIVEDHLTTSEIQNLLVTAIEMQLSRWKS